VVKRPTVDDYLPILVLIVLGFLFAALSFAGSVLLAPTKRPTAAKLAPYECGIVPTIEPPVRFPVRFYLVAMIFIIFDIEIVFLYPFAVIFRQLQSFGLVEVLVFAAVVFVSFLFLVSNGALTWGPAKRLVRAMPSRTSESTIARIAAGPGGPGGHRDPTGPGRSPTNDPVPATTGDPGLPSGPVRAA
jgi:NADH-quinone oxidoreductase subunit A